MKTECGRARWVPGSATIVAAEKAPWDKELGWKESKKGVRDRQGRLPRQGAEHPRKPGHGRGGVTVGLSVRT